MSRPDGRSPPDLAPPQFDGELVGKVSNSPVAFFQNHHQIDAAPKFFRTRRIAVSRVLWKQGLMRVNGIVAFQPASSDSIKAFNISHGLSAKFGDLAVRTAMFMKPVMVGVGAVV